MKKTLLIISFFIELTTFGQNVTLNELIELRKSSIIGVEEFLTLRNWEFVEARKPVEKTIGNVKGTTNEGYITFAYNKDKYSHRANSFIYYFYSNDNIYHNRIFFQMSNLSKYKEVLNSVKKFNPKLVDSYVNEDGNIEKVYQGKTTTFIFTTSVAEGDLNIKSSVYYLTIIDNGKYNFFKALENPDDIPEVELID